jgi:tetratricopeptide (TPR) repeat protein
MRKTPFFLALFLGALSQAGSPTPAAALDGVRVGDCWTDESGVNHCGGSSSGSSSSDYGWTYTYGYTDGSASSSSGSSWADRAEARRLQQELAAEAAVQNEAVRINQLGIDAAKRGDWAAALQYYEQAHAAYPSDPVIADNVRSARGTNFNEEANAAYDQGDYARAVEFYRKALELKPESTVIRENLAAAENQLQHQQKLAAAEQRSGEELVAASQRLKEKFSSVPDKFASAPTRPDHGLAFKGDASRPAPNTTVPASDGLSFKGVGLPVPPAGSGLVPAKPVEPSDTSGSAWEQLKSAWSWGHRASDAPSNEAASDAARQQWDTKDAGVVDLRDRTSDTVRPAQVQTAPTPIPLPPPSDEDWLKARASAVPKLEPEDLLPAPVQATRLPEFDPTLPVAPATAPPNTAQAPDMSRMLEYEPPQAPLNAQTWETIKQDPEVRRAIETRDHLVRSGATPQARREAEAKIDHAIRIKREIMHYESRTREGS